MPTFTPIRRLVAATVRVATIATGTAFWRKLTTTMT